MISQGHPEDKENARELRKSGAVLFFSTSSNMLFVREDSGWKELGHVIPVDPQLGISRFIHVAKAIYHRGPRKTFGVATPFDAPIAASPTKGHAALEGWLLMKLGMMLPASKFVAKRKFEAHCTVNLTPEDLRATFATASQG